MSECKLIGSLDVSTQPYFDGVLERLAGERIVIDMSSVELVSAAFIGSLVRLHRRLPTSSICLSGANAFVRRIFRIVALSDAFEFAPGG